RRGPRAQRPARAGLALAPRELGVDHLVAPPVPTGLPQDARLALGARHSLGFPVDREVGDVEPLVGLPASSRRGASGRPDAPRARTAPPPATPRPRIRRRAGGRPAAGPWPPTRHGSAPSGPSRRPRPGWSRHS